MLFGAILVDQRNLLKQKVALPQKNGLLGNKKKRFREFVNMSNFNRQWQDDRNSKHLD